MTKLLCALLLYTQATFSSFPNIDYVESINGTDISFVQEVDRNQFTQRKSILSSDTLDKLEVSVKEEFVRKWIDVCLFSKRTN